MAKRILVVDDEPDLLDIVSIMLEHGGYEVETAPTAEKALRMLQKGSYDAILLDLHLPGMQGEELCRTVKANDRMKHIPVILFSVSSEDMKIRTEMMGADDYIIKPFAAEQILKKIQKFV